MSFPSFQWSGRKWRWSVLTNALSATLQEKHVSMYFSLYTVGVSVEKRDVRERVFSFCHLPLSHGTHTSWCIISMKCYGHVVCLFVCLFLFYCDDCVKGPVCKIQCFNQRNTTLLKWPWRCCIASLKIGDFLGCCSTKPKEWRLCFK